MSAALAAMEALHIAADVTDTVCDEMVRTAAEVGHVSGAQFLQIVVDEGVKAALAMKLREKLHIASVVPPRRVSGDARVLSPCTRVCPRWRVVGVDAGGRCSCAGARTSSSSSNNSTTTTTRTRCGE
jgi:hypothetical protein